MGRINTREQEEMREGRLLLKNEGVKNFRLVEGRDLNSYQVRSSKHGPTICFKFSYKLMP
jgi:hypothetical protein